MDSKTIAFINDKGKYFDTIKSILKGVFILQTFLRHDEKPMITVNQVEMESLLEDRFKVLDKQIKSLPDKVYAEYLLTSK